jgi:hypothetical protein
MTEIKQHFMVIKLEGRTIDKALSLKIPESWIEDLYKSEHLSFDIIIKTEEEHSILHKTSNEKIKIK